MALTLTLTLIGRLAIYSGVDPEGYLSGLDVKWDELLEVI